MKTQEFATQTETAYGKAIPKPVSYNGTWTEYESIDELKAANAFPSNDDILKLVNNKRKANAKMQAMNAALKLAGYEKPTLENSPQLQLKTVYKGLKASGKSEAEARAIASQVTGISWADDDDDE